MLTVLILDLDGPILEGQARQYGCYAEILRENGYEPIPPETYWEWKRERVSVRQQLAASGAESLTETFQREWLERIEQSERLLQDTVQPGAKETLQEWQAQDLRLIVATQRRNAEGLFAQLSALGLDGYFETVLVCAHGENKAGRVQAYLGEVAPETCVWIGDTEADIEAARAFGCPIWAVTCGVRSEKVLARLQPDRLAGSLSVLR